MKSYITQIKMSLLLMTRNRGAFIMGYAFPLAFFFLFGSMGGASAAGNQLGMVLTLGVLGTGLFGGAMIPVMNREQNILRRFKVAPITPGPILGAGIAAGLFMYLPMALTMIVLANRVYHVPFPTQPISLFVFIAIGVITFCTIGNMIASVVNTMQEAQVVINLVYLPSLLLSGATFPVTIMPKWVQILSNFLPSAHFYTGAQTILTGRETIFDISTAVGALLLTAAIGTFLAFKLFRWEKEEKVKPSAKMWLLAALAPFIVMGVQESYTQSNTERSKVIARQQARSRAWLVHDARIFTGDGQVIERGSVLVKNGKIEKIYTGDAPDAKSLDAEALEGVGKTLLPGFIDAQVNLGVPGIVTNTKDNIDETLDRELAAYLYSGVVAINIPTSNELIKRHADTIISGAKLGAEVFNVPNQATTKLAACEALDALQHKSTAPLDRSLLIKQVVPVAQLEKTKSALESIPAPPAAPCEAAKQSLLTVFHAGQLPAPSSAAGSPMMVHGPGIHRELQLWVEAGIPAKDALQAATMNAAKRIQANTRLGAIKPGYDASMFLVDGNPVEDIAATERISLVMYKGEVLNRGKLFDQK